MKWRVWFLVVTILAAVVVVYFFPPIPQNETYHMFADHRALLGIPNCLNTTSNILFLFVGWFGMRFVLQKRSQTGNTFIDPSERWPYFVFFLAVFLTTFGSAWYHLRPRDDRLLWDRLPMSFGFMALVSAILAERIGVKIGVWLLTPLLALGAGSVLYWDITQSDGHGDLRAYALVQFGSLLVLLLLVSLFRARYTRGADLIISLAIYVVAKILEVADHIIFSWGGIVSGHTLKHVAAAISAFWILRMIVLRKPILTPVTFPTSDDRGT
ncbi:MAG: alkaline phytoceramidase [Candidatus Acidiferrales bacterium]